MILDIFEGFVPKIVNELQDSRELWKKTAVLVTFDEGGGYLTNDLFRLAAERRIEELDSTTSFSSRTKAQPKSGLFRARCRNGTEDKGAV
jgi:hypothetical protein